MTLYYGMLYYRILFYSILYYTTSFHTISCCVVLYVGTCLVAPRSGASPFDTKSLMVLRTFAAVVSATSAAVPLAATVTISTTTSQPASKPASQPAGPGPVKSALDIVEDLQKSIRQ